MGTKRTSSKSSVGLRGTSTGKSKDSGGPGDVAENSSSRATEADTTTESATAATEAADVVSGDLFSSLQDILEFTGWSKTRFYKVHKKYPLIDAIGVTGQIYGRFCVTEDQIRIWLNYVQRQESRHPDMRRLRPEEPPGLIKIQGR